MAEIATLYLHGLGHGGLHWGERILLERSRQKGINVVPAVIDWQSKETFQQLLYRITKQAIGLLDNMGKLGRLVVEGSSAGGSLAISTIGLIDDPRVRIISHSGRLRAGNFARTNRHSLEHCAHLGTGQESTSFYKSVLYCENVATPLLSEEDKSHILITKPLADEVVPISTMTIEGVRTATMPIAGHSLGIGMGILRAPSLIEELL